MFWSSCMVKVERRKPVADLLEPYIWSKTKKSLPPLVKSLTAVYKSIPSPAKLYHDSLTSVDNRVPCFLIVIG